MAKPLVLLVDDDKVYLSLTKRFLELKGYAVKTATDPNGAVKALQHRTFSAALIDLRLCNDTDPSDFSGLDLACRIARFNPLPILLLTKHATYEAAVRALSIHQHGKRLIAEIVLKQHGFDSLFEALESMLLPKKVFISYIHEDATKVKRIYNRLEKAGFKPWMDSYQIKGGTRWQHAIQRAISEADFCVICISQHSEDRRGYYRWEVNAAIELCLQKTDDEIFVIPVRLDASAIKTEALKPFQWINLYEPRGIDRLLEALRAGGQRYLHPGD